MVKLYKFILTPVQENACNWSATRGRRRDKKKVTSASWGKYLSSDFGFNSPKYHLSIMVAIAALSAAKSCCNRGYLKIFLRICAQKLSPRVRHRFLHQCQGPCGIGAWKLVRCCYRSLINLD